MATMNKAMNKVNTSTTSTRTVELTKAYSTKQICMMLGISHSGLMNVLKHRPDLKPAIKLEKGRYGTYMWSGAEMMKIREYYKNKSKKHNSETVTSTSTTLATPSTQTTTLATQQTSSPLTDMFNAFIEIEAEESKNENRAANRKFRSLFEKMTEKDMQNFFAPMLERFKYAFITKNVNNVQSQTLTCIRSGKLRGISKYQLTYSAFLELCKFAAENNCPLNLPTTEA